MRVNSREKAIIEWEAIEDMIDALKNLVDLHRQEGNSEREDIYSYLTWASDKAYAERKKLRGM